MAETASAESKPQVNLDGLGIFWIAFALSWTLIVAGGMMFLWHRRDMSILRIRGLPLSFLAITLLHLYWCTVQTGYVYLPLAIAEVEYWIMSIYLPCGIALFHASNTRFLLVAKAQKELFTSDAASIQTLYVPAMSAINNVWVPPQWIAISIMMLEIITIFLPCWEVIRHQALRQKVIDSIAQWQRNKKHIGMASKSIATSSTTVASSSRTRWSKDGSTKSDSDEIILTMEALECVLERNPGPLQQFSALRDFSGENIAFLGAVAYWKSSFPAAVRDPDMNKDNAVQELICCEQFNSALQIYTNFVSSRDAKFPINLSSQDLKRLELVFEPSARILCGEKRDVDPATPFESFAMATKVKSSSASSHGSEAGIMAGSINETDAMRDKVLHWGDIPDGFNATIFDDAEASIKYLVLTNTWPKFVKERRCSINSNDTIEAGNVIHATR
ncbi:hypothetical protein NW754_000277 [Fusarium falciforme]|nr:hypothetical protein NW754_000277 [Fusarium falciforme]